MKSALTKHSVFTKENKEGSTLDFHMAGILQSIRYYKKALDAAPSDGTSMDVIDDAGRVSKGGVLNVSQTVLKFE